MGVSNKYIKGHNSDVAVLAMFFKDLLQLQWEHLSVRVISIVPTKLEGL